MMDNELLKKFLGGTDKLRYQYQPQFSRAYIDEIFAKCRASNIEAYIIERGASMGKSGGSYGKTVGYILKDRTSTIPIAQRTFYYANFTTLQPQPGKLFRLLQSLFN